MRPHLLFGLLSVVLCASDWDCKLPKGFPQPPVPFGNPVSAAKVELGRRLFYDRRMSVNGKHSCALPSRAFYRAVRIRGAA